MSNVLPADTFIVVNKTSLSDKDRNILMLLYQPIIGSGPISLYYTLWSDLDKSEFRYDMYKSNPSILESPFLPRWYTNPGWATISCLIL